MVSHAERTMRKMRKATCKSIAATLFLVVHAFFLDLVMPVAGAIAQTAQIVGTGAVSCGQFGQAVDSDPDAIREYFAWAQGYMSGVMIRSPAGVDDALDISSNSMPIIEQMNFIRIYCMSHRDREYADAIQALYHVLGGRGM